MAFSFSPFMPLQHDSFSHEELHTAGLLYQGVMAGVFLTFLVVGMILPVVLAIRGRKVGAVWKCAALGMVSAGLIYDFLLPHALNLYRPYIASRFIDWPFASATSFVLFVPSVFWAFTVDAVVFYTKWIFCRERLIREGYWSDPSPSAPPSASHTG